jgi:acetyl-CoA acetyltransferase
VDTSLGWRFINPVFSARDGLVSKNASAPVARTTLSMGETAEEVAALDGITRQECDAFSLRSHQRAIADINAGRFRQEIVPVHTKSGIVEIDEGPRNDSSMERLGMLPTIFREGEW